MKVAVPILAAVTACWLIAIPSAIAAEPVGVVVVRIANVEAVREGEFEVSAAASPVATGKPSGSKRIVKLKKGESLNQEFEFTLADDPFDWKIIVQPIEAGRTTPRPLFVSGKVSLVDVVRALNEGDGQPVPYDFGPVQRPDADYLRPTGSPASMEFKDVRSASVAACVVVANYQGSEQPDYRLWFDANGDRRREDAEIVTDTLQKVDNGWCTRHRTVISKEERNAFTLEQKDPKSEGFVIRAEGDFYFDSADVDAKLYTDPTPNDPKQVSVSAVSVRMFGVRDSFELTLGNPFLSTLDVKGLDKGRSSQQLCYGSDHCQDVPEPPESTVEKLLPPSIGTRIFEFIKDNRRFAPMATVGILLLGFFAIRTIRKATISA